MIDIEELKTWPYIFVLNDHYEMPAVSLLRRKAEGDWDEIWALAWPSKTERDDVFRWLWQRQDRWPLWGAIAAERSKEGFRSHLLSEIRRSPSPD